MQYRPKRRTAAPRYTRARDDQPRGRKAYRPRYSAEDEELDELPVGEEEFADLTDTDLDAILEVDEDEITEEVLPEGEECPVGCKPVEDNDEESAEEDKEEEEEDEEAEEEDEEEEEEAKEASTEERKAKWAPLYDESDVSRLAETDVDDVAMYLYEASTDPHYVVIANGKAVGEIHLADMDVDEDGAALFTADTFPKGVIQTIEQLGLHNTLGDMNIRYYAAQVTAASADDAAKQAVTADLEGAFQTRMAEMKERFFNNMLLAAQAGTKNVFLKNPLRDAIRKNFRGAGVPDAVTVDLFEDAMHEAGADYIASLIKKADEWLGFEKEAMSEIEAAINEADYSHPAERGLHIDPTLPERPAQQSVPLRTSAPAPRRQAEVETGYEASEAAVKNLLRNAGTLKRGGR